MKKFLVVLLLLTSCASQHKGHYTNKEGRTKQKYYDAIQYGDKGSVSSSGKKMDKVMKKKREKTKRK